MKRIFLGHEKFDDCLGHEIAFGEKQQSHVLKLIASTNLLEDVIGKGGVIENVKIRAGAVEKKFTDDGLPDSFF